MHSYFLLFLSLLPASVWSQWSIGHTEYRVLSEVSGILYLQSCFDKNLCHNDTKTWDNIVPYEIVEGDLFVYEVQLEMITLPEVKMIVLMKNEDESATLIDYEEVEFSLTREYSNFTVETVDGQNVSFSIRNVCNQNQYKDDCTETCIPNLAMRKTCSSEGERGCLTGWQGFDCDRPICGNCNMRGFCVAPGKCSCISGWEGDSCADCITSEDCVHGTCARYHGHMKPYTCECEKGFFGENCNNTDICYFAQPCRNGLCMLNDNSTGGFECDCKRGFVGPRCEERAVIPFNCTAEGTCQNGGKCIQVDDRSICKCPIGVRGKYCEKLTLKKKPDCSTKKCDDGYICIMDDSVPLCINSVTPGPFVTVRRNASSVIYHFYFGEFHWKVRNATVDIEKAINNALEHTSVNVYYVQPKKKTQKRLFHGKDEEEEDE